MYRNTSVVVQIYYTYMVYSIIFNANMTGIALHTQVGSEKRSDKHDTKMSRHA